MKNPPFPSMDRGRHDGAASFETFLDSDFQTIRQGQADEVIDVGDVLTEQRVENGVTIAREIISKPPHPVASFGNQQFLMREIPLRRRNMAFSFHERSARAEDPFPRLMIFGMPDPDS